MALFDGIFNSGPQDAARDAQVAGLQKGATEAGNAITTGQTNTNADYSAALAPYQQNYDIASAGNTAYGNATGINGAAGYAKALQDFHTSPGYDWVLSQGNQNVLRNQSQSGQLASGGTNIDLLTYGQGLANQNWQQYITNLLPYLNQSNVAAQGIGTTNVAKAGTDQTTAKQLADLAWSKNTGIGNANANAELADINTNANTLNFAGNAVRGLAGYLPV